ncbi:ATP-binding cassette domain-containing protein [Paenibacillus aestuarii]|uniref:ATP-binding cassette domain-containing protein n=1 Tax=Paenibacillus aestuarii TaxID=516965 RepID=A0ABW0K3J9_9BACL|nr:ATP-binding cassette domain-containing protein [Paenibacillus aestuarii]
MLGQFALHNPAPGRDILRLEGLEVRFGDIQALHNVNFTLQYGELRFLVGPHGSGKTTLLHVISGKVKPSQGHVLFKDSIDLTKHQEQQIAQLGIGRKSQAPSVFSTLTVFENLALSLKQQRGLLSALWTKMTSEQRDRLHHRLAMIGLQSKAKERAGSLSHAEKQWLEIGMLLMQEPELLLLDEPTAGMTVSEAEQTGELLHAINAEQTILVAERDLAFVRCFAGKVTLLREGALLRESLVQELLNDDKAAETFLGRKVERGA